MQTSTSQEISHPRMASHHAARQLNSDALPQPVVKQASSGALGTPVPRSLLSKMLSETPQSRANLHNAGISTIAATASPSWQHHKLSGDKQPAVQSLSTPGPLNQLYVDHVSGQLTKPNQTHRQQEQGSRNPSSNPRDPSDQQMQSGPSHLLSSPSSSRGRGRDTDRGRDRGRSRGRGRGRSETYASSPDSKKSALKFKPDKIPKFIIREDRPVSQQNSPTIISQEQRVQQRFDPVDDKRYFKRSDVVQSSAQTDHPVVFLLAPIVQTSYNPAVAKELLQVLTNFFNITNARYIKMFEELLSGTIGLQAFIEKSLIGTSVTGFFHFRCALLAGDIHLTDIHPLFAGKQLQRTKESSISDFFSFFHFLTANMKTKEDLFTFTGLFTADLSWNEFSEVIAVMENTEKDYWNFRTAVFKDNSLLHHVLPYLNSNNWKSEVWKILYPLYAPMYEPQVARKLAGQLKEELKTCPQMGLECLKSFLAGSMGLKDFSTNLGITSDLSGFSHLRQALLQNDVQLSAIHPLCSRVSVESSPELGIPDFDSFMNIMKPWLLSTEKKKLLTSLLAGDCTLSEACSAVDLPCTLQIENMYWNFRKACQSQPNLQNKLSSYMTSAGDQSSACSFNSFSQSIDFETEFVKENHIPSGASYSRTCVPSENLQYLLSPDTPSKPSDVHHINPSAQLSDKTGIAIEIAEDVLSGLEEEARPSEENDRLSTPSPILEDTLPVKSSVDALVPVVLEQENKPEVVEDIMIIEPIHQKSDTNNAIIHFDSMKVKQFESVFSSRFADPKLTQESRNAAKKALILFINGGLMPRDFVTCSRINWGYSPDSMAKLLAEWLPHIQAAVFQKKFELSSLHWAFGDVSVSVSERKLSLQDSIPSNQSVESCVPLASLGQKYSLSYKAHCKILLSQEAVSIARKFLVVSASPCYLFLPESLNIPDNLVDSYTISCTPWGVGRIKVELPDRQYPAKTFSYIVEEIDSYKDFEDHLLNLKNLHQSYAIIQAVKFEDLCIEFEKKNYLEIGVQIMSGSNQFFQCAMHQLFGTNHFDTVCNAISGQVNNMKYIVIVGKIYLLFLPRRLATESCNFFQFGDQFTVSRCQTRQGKKFVKLKVSSGIFHLACPQQAAEIRQLAINLTPFVFAWEEFYPLFKDILQGAQPYKVADIQREIVCIASADLYIMKKSFQVVFVYLKQVQPTSGQESIFKLPVINSILKFDCISIVSDTVRDKFLTAAYDGNNKLLMKETEEKYLFRCQFVYETAKQNEAKFFMRTLVKASSNASVAIKLETENVLTDVHTIEALAAKRRDKGQDLIANWRSLFGVQEAECFHQKVLVDKMWKENPSSSPAMTEKCAAPTNGSSTVGKFQSQCVFLKI